VQAFPAAVWTLLLADGQAKLTVFFCNQLLQLQLTICTAVSRNWPTAVCRSEQRWPICPQPSKCHLSPAMVILTGPPEVHKKTLTLLECLAQTTQVEPSPFNWPYHLQNVTEIRYCQCRFILSKTTRIAWCVIMVTNCMRCITTWQPHGIYHTNTGTCTMCTAPTRDFIHSAVCLKTGP